MSETSWREEIGPLVRISQIIVLALVAGTVVFLTVALVLVSQGAFGPGGEDPNAAAPGDDTLLLVMNITLVLFLIAHMIARLILPGLIVSQQRRKIASGQWDPPNAGSWLPPSIAPMIVPGLIVSQQRRKIASGQWDAPDAGSGFASSIEPKGDAGRLMGVFQTKTIIAAALLEGVAIFATIVFMLTQSIIGLTIAILMIVGLLFHIPTRSSVTHWIDDQLAIIEQERSLGA